jgi:antirestriction protein ArdC
MPKNASTHRRYSGINVLILWGAVVERCFSGQSWLTFRQALSLGGHVRKGEQGTIVVYADRFTPDDERRRAAETGEEAQAIPFLKRFTVFNTAQCEGLPDEMVAVAPPVETGLVLPQAEALIRATGVDFRIGGERAFYDPRHDFVQVPPPQAYFEAINWHRTALHELGHASGAVHRLNRDLSGSFGTRKYAFEELVAEMNAAFCCASLSIVPTVRHADYIASWLEFCARTTAPSSAPPHRRARPPTTSSASCRRISGPPLWPPTAMSERLHDAAPPIRESAHACLRLCGFPGLRPARESEGCAGFRDGLEVERESLDRPSRRLPRWLLPFRRSPCRRRATFPSTSSFSASRMSGV